MAIYVYGKAEEFQEEEWIGWTTDPDEASRLARSYVEKYTCGFVLTLIDGGTVAFDYFHYEPEPYTGPTVQAKVDYMGAPGCHRIPIDCANPRVSSRQPLTRDHPWRCVATSVMPTPDSPEPSRPFTEPQTCLCGDWQEIEGSPEAVAEMVAKYPVQ